MEVSLGELSVIPLIDDPGRQGANFLQFMQILNSDLRSHEVSSKRDARGHEPAPNM